MEPNITLPKEKAIKIYTCVLYSVGTGISAIQLHNTTGQIPIWSRTGAGEYLITFTGGVLESSGKTIAFVGALNGATPAIVTAIYMSTNTYRIQTYNTAGTLGDDLLNGTAFELRIYN